MSALVDQDLFTGTPDGRALLGSRCADCAAHVFPRQDGCPRCTGGTMEDVPLARRGVLWAFTVQGFRPKPPYTGPEEFAPYGVGYVELPGQVIVEARLTEADPERLRIGMPMVLTWVPFRQEEDGTPVLTYAFAPETQEER